MENKNSNMPVFIILTIFLIIGLAAAIFAYYSLSKKENYVIIKTEKEAEEISKTDGQKNNLNADNVGDKNIIQNTAVIKTNFGDIKLKLFNSDAPKTAENFIKLSKSGFYDKVKFHRVIKGFMIQGGDPKSKDDNWTDDGAGGPGYSFEDEINSHKMVKGVIAMANSGPDTNGSQFFIVTADAAPWLDGKHTVFGEVTEGIDTIFKIENVSVNQNDHPTKDVIIEKIEII